MKEDDLFFITESYPYGKGEEFIENELLVLSKYYKKVHLFPSVFTDNRQRPIPENVVLYPAPVNYNKLHTFFSNPFLVLRLLAIDFIKCRSKFFFLSRIKRFIGLICYSIFLSKEFKFPRNENKFIYCFWMHEAALALAILKEKGEIKDFIFRVHGGDLFDERKEGNHMPFRDFNMKMARNVYSVSKAGYEYLKNKNIYPEKVRLSRLGVFDKGNNPFSPAHEFTLVSNSSLIPLKRVFLIIEALKFINFELKWVHFGDGPLMADISQRTKSLGKNIDFELKGYISNSEILKYYRETPCHLFIHLSETEGLPACIQEAISFGIPVLATNVGGVSEIVNDQTGILIDKDTNSEEIAKLIISFKSSPMNSLIFRERVKSFWAKEFNAEVNYSSFIKELSK
jgi:glycosyltransferase involved in cell wall biosynthesis